MYKHTTPETRWKHEIMSSFSFKQTLNQILIGIGMDWERLMTVAQ